MPYFNDDVTLAVRCLNKWPEICVVCHFKVYDLNGSWSVSLVEWGRNFYWLFFRLFMYINQELFSDEIFPFYTKYFVQPCSIDVVSTFSKLKYIWTLWIGNRKGTIPADTWCNNNVSITSKLHHDVDQTSHWLNQWWHSLLTHIYSASMS